MTVCQTAGERQGRYYSDEYSKWYDSYPCTEHGIHIDVDWDSEW